METWRFSFRIKNKTYNRKEKEGGLIMALGIILVLLGIYVIATELRNKKD